MRATEFVPSGLRVLRLITFAVGCVPYAIAQTATPTATAVPAKQSSISFKGGLLTVTASNASLNGILREIARTTGMKISGNVPEDRVFGKYGPEDPQRVLATLLDGTGTNILILSNDADKPLELVLTHRTGTVSPPNPNGTAEADADNSSGQSASEPMAVSPTPRTVAQRRPLGKDLPPAGHQPSEVTQPVVFAPIGTTTAPATASTTPVDPDDANDPDTESVKTPQEIFEELQKLQQGNAQGAGTATNPKQ